MKKDLQIIQMIGIVGERPSKETGEKQTLELNLIRNDKNGLPIFDLRWWEDNQPLYGLQLTERSLAELAELIEYYFKDFYNDKKKTVHPKVQRAKL